MCCSVGFFKEFITVSLVKMSQINTENNKKPMNFSIFKVNAFLVKVSTDFVGWNALKGQQGKSLLSRSLHCNVLNENVSN